MAYGKIKKTDFTRVIKKYGANSIEHEVLELIEKTRLTFESIAPLVRAEQSVIEQDLTGGVPADDKTHNMAVKMLQAVLPTGLEWGVLPCQDTDLATNILKLLVHNFANDARVARLQRELEQAKNETN